LQTRATHRFARNLEGFGRQDVIFQSLTNMKENEGCVLVEGHKLPFIYCSFVMHTVTISNVLLGISLILLIADGKEIDFGGAAAVAMSTIAFGSFNKILVWPNIS